MNGGGFDGVLRDLRAWREKIDQAIAVIQQFAND
jgi:hypothetical protein